MAGLFRNLRFSSPDFSGIKRTMNQAWNAAARAYRATASYLSDCWDRGKYALSDYGPGGEEARSPEGSYKRKHTVPGWWFWGLVRPLPLILLVLLTTIATNTGRAFKLEKLLIFYINSARFYLISLLRL